MNSMTDYKTIREYLDAVSKKGSVMGLDSIRNLMEKLGNPQKKLRIVHFAGTNGKGSTIAFTESILKKAGYKVAKYTSPAVFEYMEMFRYNGENISEKEYSKYMSLIIEKCKEMEEEGLEHPTSFEMETALAFLFFSKTDADIVLLETGMGGLTDATNIVESVLCSVITTIGMDHMAFLGNTIEEIAEIKSGIIKHNCPTVTYKQDDDVMNVIKKSCLDKKSRLHIANIKDYSLSAKGSYQKINASVAAEVAQVLNEVGYEISEKDIKSGIESMFIEGRFEEIHHNPNVIIDGAHNPCAAEQLRKTIDSSFAEGRLIFIMGALVDKDYRNVAKTVLRKTDTVYTVSTSGRRKLDAEVLASAISDFCKEVIVAEKVESAVDMAVSDLKQNGAQAIIAFGSLSFLGDLKKEVQSHFTNND